MVMDANKLRRFASDPAAFRAELLIPAARGPARLSDVAADFQRRDFQAIDGALMALRDGRKPELSRLWLERTKGGSKDTDLAAMLLWLLAFSNRPLTCQVGAADQGQADELRRAAKSIARLNPWLQELIDIQAMTLINQRTECRADIIAADVAGSHGARPDLLILNELSHVTRREFAENLLDNASKMPGGVVIIATNAGWLDTWQQQWREQARTSARWYFSAFSRPAPWIDPAELEEARRRNPPCRFARLWDGVWSSDVGDALPGDDLAAAVSEDAGLTGAESGWCYFGGLDLGVRHDHSALAVVGLHVGWTEYSEVEPQPERPIYTTLREVGVWPQRQPELQETVHEGTGRLRLATCLSWKPVGGKVDLQTVEAAVLEQHARYRFGVLLYDPSQAELMAQRCLGSGVPMIPLPFVGGNLSDLASTLVSTFTARQFTMHQDPDLLADLRKLRIVESGFGLKLTAAKDERGHADRGIALAIALLAAKRFGAARVWRNDGRDLVLWPPADYARDPLEDDRMTDNESGWPVQPTGWER